MVVDNARENNVAEFFGEFRQLILINGKIDVPQKDGATLDEW